MDIKLPFLSKLKKIKIDFRSKIFAVFVIGVSLAPLALVAFHFIEQLQEISFKKESLFDAKVQATRLLVSQREKRNFFQEYHGADHFYLEKELESMSFLQKQKKALLVIANDPMFSHAKMLENQLLYLANNTLKFSEKARIDNGSLVETKEMQIAPIEVDHFDLANLLEKIEGDFSSSSKKAIKKPQLIIKEFDLEKNENEQYKLKLELIKREYL